MWGGGQKWGSKVSQGMKPAPPPPPRILNFFEIQRYGQVLRRQGIAIRRGHGLRPCREKACAYDRDARIISLLGVTIRGLFTEPHTNYVLPPTPENLL